MKIYRVKYFDDHMFTKTLVIEARSLDHLYDRALSDYRIQAKNVLSVDQLHLE